VLIIELFGGILLLVQGVALWQMYVKHQTLTAAQAQHAVQHQEQIDKIQKASEDHLQKYQLAVAELDQVRQQKDRLTDQVAQLTQQAAFVQQTPVVKALSADNLPTSDLDHNVGIMIELWSEHISQVVDHQAGEGDQIALRLDTVVEDVKLVSSDLDITRCVTRLVDLVYESRGTLNALLDEQQNGADEKRQTIQELDTAVQQINRVEEIVQVMHKLTFTTQLLASNAAVAAARASGEEGRAFKVIAVRMAEFAHEISASAREISRVIGDFKTIFDRSLDKTQQQMQNDLQLHDQHSQRVNAVMETLVSSVENANKAGSQLAGALVTLESDVAFAVRNVMVSLQYQDRMKQILDHVSRSLRDVACRLETGENLDIESLLKQEMSSYTTQEERELYRRKLSELGFVVEETAGEEHVLDNGEMMFF
jgi:methyl-accepting chemotaxis protein